MGDPAEEGYVYDLWLTVLLRGGAAAFADIMGSLLAGAIPAMAWQSMAAIRRELARGQGLWIHHDEVRDATAALRHHPHRRYVLPARSCLSAAPTVPQT